VHVEETTMLKPFSLALICAGLLPFLAQAARYDYLD
jgi:hypothetical protein